MMHHNAVLLLTLLFWVGTRGKGAAGACTVSVQQPGYLAVDHTSEAVTIQCTFSTEGCPSEQPTSLWFRYGPHQPETLCLDGCRNKADKFTVTETLSQKEVSLTVNRVSTNDSAIYICGIAFSSALTPKAKLTGSGTTLVVRESKGLSKQLHSLLIVLLALLSIYVTGVCVFFIVLSRSKSNSPRSKELKEDSKKKMSARHIFREIAQELYHKRFMEASQQPEKDTYENRRALSTMRDHRHIDFLTKLLTNCGIHGSMMDTNQSGMQNDSSHTANKRKTGRLEEEYCYRKPQQIRKLRTNELKLTVDVSVVPGTARSALSH